jgi:hypothetical protein
MGDARGRFDGDTLVVETTNFTNRTHFGYNNNYNSEKLRLVERFTPVAPAGSTGKSRSTIPRSGRVRGRSR